MDATSFDVEWLDLEGRSASPATDGTSQTKERRSGPWSVRGQRRSESLTLVEDPLQVVGHTDSSQQQERWKCVPPEIGFAQMDVETSNGALSHSGDAHVHSSCAMRHGHASCACFIIMLRFGEQWCTSLRGSELQHLHRRRRRCLRNENRRVLVNESSVDLRGLRT